MSIKAEKALGQNIEPDLFTFLISCNLSVYEKLVSQWEERVVAETS
jgi:hypothetical protein